MTKISREDVLNLARLARLELSEEELEKYAAEITAILGYVEMLQSIDTENVEPTYQVTGLKNVMRQDEVVIYDTTLKALLKNAPNQEKGMFKVRRMVG